MIVKTGECQALHSMPIGVREASPAKRTARFSDCMRYRYELTIQEPRGFGVATFVMLNPSTADEMKDDPTLRRCRGFALHWGMREVRIVNLFALRSTDPKGLYSSDAPVGPQNDEAIIAAGIDADKIVVGWGVHGQHLARGSNVSALLRRFTVHCLGRTKAGSPRHPLYLAGDSKLELWRAS